MLQRHREYDKTIIRSARSLIWIRIHIRFKSLFLDDYVGHIYSIPDAWDHKASLSENFPGSQPFSIRFINASSGIFGDRNRVRYDGVIIHDIREGNIFYGSGEWDAGCMGAI